MHNTVKITSDVTYIGASDRRLALFENVFPIPRGVSYNSYLINDEKTALLDTVDRSVAPQFFENLAFALGGKPLDYAVVNHMEPDHAATLSELVLRYPDVKLVCNAKTAVMMKQFFEFDVDNRAVIVSEGDTLALGKHTLAFAMAPMVHWPEVMVTYDTADKILFSADAFGTFGAINGNLFADEVDFEREWLPDARRYYTNIVGKYGTQVCAALKKVSTLDVAILCPLHGPVWRRDIPWFIEKYSRWATYTPEDDAVMIAYASVYGDTENAASILASRLAEKGVRNIAMYDVSNTHPSVIVSEAFRCSHLVFASTTYNAGIFCNMETALLDIKAHNLQNRTVALIQNGSWAATSGGLMRQIFDSMKGMTVLEEQVNLKSSVKSSNVDELESLASAIAASVCKTGVVTESVVPDAAKLDPAAFFKLSYGLFVLTARDGDRDNGCIINTVTQVTDTPKRISIAVNKANLTCEMIDKTGIFNVSVLTESAPFEVFKHFGFQSGRNADKFADIGENRSLNGVRYVAFYTNAFFSCKVVGKYDYGTHLVFIADVTESKTLSSERSVTYQYYFDHIKPKPPVSGGPKKGWICKICGYVYEGEELPPDFICPLCKHGASDFERIK